MKSEIEKFCEQIRELGYGSLSAHETVETLLALIHGELNADDVDYGCLCDDSDDYLGKW